MRSFLRQARDVLTYAWQRLGIDPANLPFHFEVHTGAFQSVKKLP
jgi:hypothetical protein